MKRNNKPVWWNKIASIWRVRYAIFRTPFFTMGILLLLYLPGCSTPPPRHQEDICQVFDQHPEWYDSAKASETKWGTPPHILMAFIRHESSFVQDAKPPRKWFLFIPLGRTSSARGYAQILDSTWQEYIEENGAWLKSRTDMRDGLDFIGWYNQKSNQQLGISKLDPKRLYLAYHEGHGGYRRGSYRKKPKLIHIAEKVNHQARQYRTQLRKCEHRFKCRKWYQFWPICKKSGMNSSPGPHRLFAMGIKRNEVNSSQLPQ